MTVCVAAFAQKSKAIVMVSDKAVTHYGVMGSDSDIQKMLPISKSKWRALVAGDPSFAKRVIGTVSARIDAQPTISGRQFTMMRCVVEAYHEVRDQELLDQVLAPRLLTKELLVARNNTMLPLPNAYVADLLEDIKAFDNKRLKDGGCSLLVCGFDARNRPHMFSVIEPGTPFDHDMAGYHAIGSGSAFAIASLLGWDVNRNKRLSEVLYRSFDAKAHGEIVNTVGFSWDGYILTAKRGWRVKLPVRNAMDDLFTEMNRSPFDKSPKKPTKKWERRVLKFSAKVTKKL